MASKKKTREISPTGKVYVTSGFNNTIITITDINGGVLCVGSCGMAGFKGSRRSTPYAAAQTATAVGRKALDLGVRELDVFVKGPGSGRDSAVKALRNTGLEINSIVDITPIPHNGCRPKGRRRI
jgi:small subunit ribosomal protein S11